MSQIPKIQIAEFILPGHPDKLCDVIADRLVDAACQRDSLSLVGVEVALHQEVVLITGCITTFPAFTATEVNAIVIQVFQDAGYHQEWLDPKRLKIDQDLRLEELNDELRHLRNISDDQAICVGYANHQQEHFYLPLAHRLAYLGGQYMKQIRQEYGLGPDGKIIVTCQDNEILHMSISLHHAKDSNRKDIFKMAYEVGKHLGILDQDHITINGGGDFDVGGPFGDNGLSGKKLVVDAYGPHIPIGGGAWSGKDPHKIDRVGGLMCRYLALRAIRLGLGNEALITFGWHPGDHEPSIKTMQIDGVNRNIELLGHQDCSIAGIWQKLRLGEVLFSDYADGSWFQKPATWNPIKQNSPSDNIWIHQN